MTFEQKLRKALATLPSLVKERMQRTGEELQVYVDANMQETTGGATQRMTEARKPNTTNKLRVVTGNLRRAFVKGKKGYQSFFTDEGAGKFSWTVSIDTAQVPYAAIHEYGGATGIGGATKIKARPYIRPALKAYQADTMGIVADDIMKRLLR